MVDRPEQPEVHRLVVVQSSWPRRVDHARALSDAKRLDLPDSDMHPADRRTWEVFWSNLLGEYAQLGADAADAA